MYHTLREQLSPISEIPKCVLTSSSLKVVFDNTNRALPIDFDEVSIERVVHRDSANEYFINGSTVRYLERWALESEGRGGTNNKLADSFIYETGSKSVITSLGHLEGEEVVCWGNGKDLGTYTVSGGAITPSETVTSHCTGLGYDATFKSTKLAYAASMGTAFHHLLTRDRNIVLMILL